MAPRAEKIVDVSGAGGSLSAKASTTVATTRGKYTWQEVAKHNTAESAWVIVEGKVYDVTHFLDKHPGGKEMLLLSAGRECTALFTSYHWATEKPRKYLSAYEIGDAVGAPEFPVYAADKAGFYATLSTRVKAYFEKTGVDPKDPLPGTIRMLPVFAVFVLGYLVMNDQLLTGSSFGVKAAAALAFGLCQVLPLLHVMHDASHAAIGHNETGWKVWGRLTLDWMAGASMMQWHHQHIIGHHQYTNVYMADPDLPNADEGDIRRLVSRQVWKSLYAWQHVYLPILYGLLAIKVRVSDVTSLWVDKMSGPVRVNAYNSLWHRIFLTKLVWAAWRIVLPLTLWKVPAGQFWALFAIAELTSGFWLAWNFEVSHLSTDVDWPNGDKASGTLADSWAVAQVKTSVDYAHNDHLMTFACGALNYQIEHHLFPGISQYHYPAIAPLVMETCREFGVPYRYERNFAGAFAAHIAYLKDMGAAGKAHHMD